jgi:hypothetical protein
MPEVGFEFRDAWRNRVTIAQASPVARSDHPRPDSACPTRSAMWLASCGHSSDGRL